MHQQYRRANHNIGVPAVQVTAPEGALRRPVVDNERIP
jgi:hypothetical protein